MIDVVMLAYNFNEELATLTEDAITSVRQAPINKLIIVDNASSVRAGMLRELSDTYIGNKTNLGYPAAVNQGVALSKAPYIAISNNDIRVSPEWYDIAEDILKNPKVASVHYRMIPYKDPIVRGNDVWLTGKERWCHSSFFVIRREAFVGYDENYDKGGYDDWDIWHRVRHINGWITAYTNKTSFQHMDSVTYRSMESQEDRHKRDLKNGEYFKTKFGEYAEDIWAKKYPDQMNQVYFPFP